MSNLFSLSKDITVNFSKEQICQILTDAIHKQGYDVIGDFDFRFGEKCSGYGPTEEYRTVFKGVSVKVMGNEEVYDI